MVMWGARKLQRIPPGDPRYTEASLIVGQRMLRGVAITPMPPDDEIYGEASIIIGMPMRPKPVQPLEPPPDSAPAEAKPMRDWTGFKPIPRFRDPLPGESRQEWWDARKVFVDEFQDKVLAELARERATQAQVDEGS